MERRVSLLLPLILSPCSPPPPSAQPAPDPREPTMRIVLEHFVDPPTAYAQSVVGDLTAAGPAVGEPANAAPPAADTATVVSATGKATAADARYGEEDEEEGARARERRRTTSGG